MKGDIIKILEKYSEGFYPNGYAGGQFISSDDFEKVAKEIVGLFVFNLKESINEVRVNNLVEGGITTGLSLGYLSNQEGGETVIPISDLNLKPVDVPKQPMEIKISCEELYRLMKENKDDQ